MTRKSVIDHDAMDGINVNPELRSGFNYDRDRVSLETGLRCEDPSLAKQSFADECDINTIVRRFNLTGQLPEGVHAPTYQDFEGVWDFQSAMNAVREAQESFDAMPAGIRARFHNDPQEFVEFCSMEENRAEAEKMGLVVARPPETPPAKADDPQPTNPPETPPLARREKGDKGVT